MDFSFTEEQESIRELAAQILDDLVSDEMLRDFEGGNRTAAEALWSQLAQANLLGVALPWSLQLLALRRREARRAALTRTALPVACSSLATARPRNV